MDPLLGQDPLASSSKALVDGNSERSDDDKLKDAIKDAYRRARAHFEYHVKVAGKEHYNAAVSTPLVYQPGSNGNIRVPDFDLPHDTNAKTKPIPLELVETLPPMKHWVNVESNTRLENEDDMLSHIPYFDKNDGASEQFVRELLELFPNGIHGVKKGCGEYINDFILYGIVEFFEEFHKDVSRETLFSLIFDLFPNKLNASEIADVYPALEARFAPTLGRPPIELDENGSAPLLVLDAPETPKPVLPTMTDAHRRELYKKFRYRLGRGGGGKVQNEYAYIPCNHAGSCERAQCSCFTKNKICTKFCKCFGSTCALQFPGCFCKPGKCGTKSCPCVFAAWECDPLICSTCHCATDKTSTGPCCKNTNFQRCVRKKISARPSKVAGWGCFSDEPIKKGEFITEYCGEIISEEESDRRGKISDERSLSYLFRLNNEFCVDAARYGNLIRFANHSTKPNCNARIIIVNAEHRIGIYAARNIEADEELFFNYSYSSVHRLNFLNLELDPKKGVVKTVRGGPSKKAPKNTRKRPAAEESEETESSQTEPDTDDVDDE